MNRIAYSSLDFRAFLQKKDDQNFIFYDINIGKRKRNDKT